MKNAVSIGAVHTHTQTRGNLINNVGAGLVPAQGKARSAFIVIYKQTNWLISLFFACI